MLSHIKQSKYFKLQTYSPYDYQKQFHCLKSENGKLAKARGLMAANQIGKTLSGGAEVAIHATGLYPDWWEGRRYKNPPNIVCSGVNSYRTRDLIQKELLGREEEGTGWIPKHLIEKTERKPGIPGAYEQVYVKHSSGISRILLLGYEDGPRKFMGERIDFGWGDEEPPLEIHEQMVRGTIATEGSLMYTFTPENGMTQVVYRFMNDCPPNYALLQAGWDDAPHITQERKEELLAEMMPHEREMRSKGIPVAGESMIFPIPDDDIICDPFEIPTYWPHILGVDFGGDHPFAVAKLAIDPQGDRKTVYLIDGVKRRRLTVSQESSIINGMGGVSIPIAWPHDGNKRDKQSGKPMADLYRDHGLNFIYKCFSNPPEPGKDEGTGGQGIEVGLKRMYWAMTEGRFKVFPHVFEFLKEKGSYHRDKNGQVVPINDDLISATRYAYQSALDANDDIRFAMPLSMPEKKKSTYQGLSNW